MKIGGIPVFFNCQSDSGVSAITLLRMLTIESALALTLVSLCVCSGFAQTTSPPASQPAYRISKETGPVRIAVIGLVHGHVEGLLWRASQKDDIQIVGIYDPNRTLFDRLAAKYKLDAALYANDLNAMLDRAKPEAASVMTSIKDHRMAFEACAPRGIHTLLEKPLAFSNEDARRMAELARENRVLVLTNYETSWYASVREAKRRIDAGLGPIRHMYFRHGHRGPREIGCAPEFVAWLTDPAQNGGGALVDFGCYGAVLATWLMDGQRPTGITAAATTLRPDRYPHVDDDATIVLTYPGATAVIGASWAWTNDNKEMDVSTEKGTLYTAKQDEISMREPDKPAQKITPTPKPPELENEWVYLRQVVRGQTPVDALSSLETNLIVVEILDAARTQVRAANNP